MRGWGRAAACGALTLGLSGCAALLVGAGAAGGYAISRDSIKNHFDLSMGHVYRAARDVAGDVGLITVEDQRRGVIRASVEGADVTITVKPISDKTVELKVKARKNVVLPAIDTAQAIYNKIRERL